MAAMEDTTSEIQYHLVVTTVKEIQGVKRLLLHQLVEMHIILTKQCVQFMILMFQQAHGVQIKFCANWSHAYLFKTMVRRRNVNTFGKICDFQKPRRVKNLSLCR